MIQFNLKEFVSQKSDLHFICSTKEVREFINQLEAIGFSCIDGIGGNTIGYVEWDDDYLTYENADHIKIDVSIFHFPMDNCVSVKLFPH